MSWLDTVKSWFTLELPEPEIGAVPEPQPEPMPEPEPEIEEAPAAEAGAETDVTVIIRDATPEERVRALLDQVGLEVMRVVLEEKIEEERRANIKLLPEDICYWDGNVLVVSFKPACRYFGIVFNEPISAFAKLQERLKEMYPDATEFRVGLFGG